MTVPPERQKEIGEDLEKNSRNDQGSRDRMGPQKRTHKKMKFPVIKRNKIELFVVRWMDLESVIQSEVIQKEKNKYSMLTHIYGI